MSVIILRGDAASLPLPDASVDLIVTSPPYWGLRDYRDGDASLAGQIGSEETPGEYIASLLRCTREWVRVLKPEGSIFVNLGDTYSKRANGGAGRTYRADGAEVLQPTRNTTEFAPRKSLLGLPWRYAIGCVDDLGLILRAEILWSKANGMPESVVDRVRRSHEQVFHLVKQPRYFAAVDEIRQAHKPQSVTRSSRRYDAGDLFSVGTPNTLDPRQFCNPLGALPGSVWEIASQPLAVPARLGADHYAAFPMELPRRIILGWSPSGICEECGEGRRPLVADDAEISARVSDLARKAGASWKPDGAVPKRTLGPRAEDRNRRITGSACACPDASAPTRGAVVVDPFGGTGTTALVASALGRTGITVDRSADYCRIAQWRTSDPAERARALGVAKPPPVMTGQGSLLDGLEAS